ncbi:MAG: hypothetical protein KAX40_00345 [Herpetosiphon sp.]|nr:hypothetical protein [Herpetosiphon sp.]
MNPLSDRQREQLSAYIDKSLSSAETAELERQLAGDQALAAELRELQITRSLLQDLPAVRPPRSFTLDPAAYAPKRATFSWMRWAAVLGAFVLMLTVGLSLSNLGGAQTTSSSAPLSAASGANPAPANEEAARSADPAAAAAATQVSMPTTAASSEGMAAAATAAPAQSTEAPMAAVGGAAPMATQAATADQMFKSTTEVPPAAGNLPYDSNATPELSDGSTMIGATGSATGTLEQQGNAPTQVAGFEALEVAQPTLERTDTSSPDTRQLDRGTLDVPAESQTSRVSLGWLFLIMLIVGIALAAFMLQRSKPKHD